MLTNSLEQHQNKNFYFYKCFCFGAEKGTKNGRFFQNRVLKIKTILFCFLLFRRQLQKNNL
jgi:hypothetical protein